VTFPVGTDGKELDGAELGASVELEVSGKKVDEDIGYSMEELFDTGVDEGTELPVPTGPTVLKLANVVAELGAPDEESGYG
jgi:hypothetical protein